MSVSIEDRSFRRIDGLSRVLRTLLAVGIVADVIYILVTFIEIQTLERYRSGDASLQEATNAIDRSGDLGIVLTGIYLTTVVIWLIWQHRAQANLHARGLSRLTFSPGWAVGWWLIPVANLWKPFQTTRELWKASGGGEWWRTATWPVIGWWWAGYVVFNIVDNLTIRFWGSSSATLNTFVVGDWLSIAGDLGSIVTAILAMSIVRAVTERQAALETIDAVPSQVPARPDQPDNLNP
jgi:hypothetical protein